MNIALLLENVLGIQSFLFPVLDAGRLMYGQTALFYTFSLP